jgi:TRAP-type uncharacterized transport system substrate-binding protein
VHLSLRLTLADDPVMSLLHYVKTVIQDEIKAVGEQFRESKTILVAFLLCLFGVIAYLQPFPDRHIYIGSSYQGGDWFNMAEASAKFLSEKGLDSQVVITKGAVDNVDRLIDPADPVNAAYTYGMTLDDEKRQRIVSLGSVSYEPIWVFYRKSRTGDMDNLRDLLRHRVALGPKGSGSYAVASKIMKIYEVDITQHDNFIPDDFEKSADRFKAGGADALIMVSTAWDPIVQTLMRTPGVEVMNFKNAEAFDKKDNSLESVRLPAGSISIYPQIPARDISLVATTTSVVVKKEMHPDLQLALLMTMKKMNRASENLFFARRNEFPAYVDPAVPISPVAAKFYDYGPPQAMRYLPFWIAGFVDRAWLLLLGLVAVFYPLSKLNLHVRKLRFVVHERPLYEELLEIDKRVSTQTLSSDQKGAISQRLDEINRHAINHSIPIGEEPHYFDLVMAIDLIRKKMEPPAN